MRREILLLSTACVHILRKEMDTRKRIKKGKGEKRGEIREKIKVVEGVRKGNARKRNREGEQNFSGETKGTINIK
jgi:hypothetical protein